MTITAVSDRRPRTVALAGSVVALTLALRIPSLAEPGWDHDEGVFTTVAWSMSNGFTLYERVYDLQPPGIYWLYWLLLAAGGGQHHIIVQVAVCVFAAAAAVLTFAIARRFLTLWPATVAGCLVGFVLAVPPLGGNHLNVELAALPFFLGGLALAFSSRLVAVFAAGTLVGVALVLRPSFLLDGAALLVPLLAARRRPLLIVIAALGLASALALAAFGLWLEGSWRAYVEIVAPSDRRYFLVGNGNSLEPVVVRVALLALVSLLCLRRSRSFGDRLMSVWLPASLAGSTLTPVSYVHYVHESLPPLAIAIAMVAGRAPRRWPTLPLAALGMILCAEAMLVLPEQETAFLRGQHVPPVLGRVHAYDMIPAYYENWFGLVSGSESSSSYDASFSGVAARQRELARLQEADTLSGSSLLVINGDMWLYYEANDPPATRYLTMWVGEWLVPAADDEIRTKMHDGCIDIVVVDNTVSKFNVSDLTQGGYVQIPEAPWPTFRSTHRGTACLG